MPMSELSSGAKQLQESMQRLFIAARNGDLTPNEYRKEQQRLLSSAPPSIAQELIEYNTVLNTDLLNETQFYREPTLPVDEAAYDAVTYMGRVPFGSEDSKYLYRRGSSGVRGVNVEPTEYGKSVGGIEHILIAGRNLYNENTPVIEHEGLHAVGEPQGVDDEVATRALDYFRYQRLGDEEGMRRVAEGLRKNGFSAFDPENPESMKFLRLYAAKKAMSMDPEYLDLMDKEALSAAHDARIEEPGIFDALGELVGGEPAEPEFEPFLMGPRHMRDFSDEEFQTFLDEAPAFQYEPMQTQPRTSTVTPRMVPEGDSMVRGYQNGGPVGPPEDPQGDLFPDAIKEGIGTLVEYAPKVMKVASRGVGDLVRSEPVSPPEFAVSRPTELTEFQMETETLRPEELDMISDSVIGKLFSDDVVQRLEDPEERAGLFLYADKPGVTDAPPKSSLLRDTVRRSLEEQKNAFDKLRYEGQAGLREEVPLLSRSAVMKNVFNVLRDQIGPEAMSRIGDDRLLNIVEQSVRQSTVKGMADGGVVSLKDRAVNMTRGPRSNGIMQYVPYMTGATNGY